MLAYQKADPKNVGLLGRISHDILNVLEDGYIENRMLMDYPGILGSSLRAWRKNRLENFPTIEDMIDREEDGRAYLDDHPKRQHRLPIES